MSSPLPVSTTSQPAETWTVHRQDDYGNRDIVQSGLSREEAERLVSVFEARGHKQYYWAERDHG